MKPEDFTPDQQLLALTWKQPYADMMLTGKIETRTWPTKYRGWVLICAGKSQYESTQVLAISGAKQMNRIITRRFQMPIEIKGHSGKAIGIGRLVDCRKMTPADEDKCMVQYHPDLYCHVYDHVQPIEPFPWKGSQGWREVEQVIKDQITTLIFLNANDLD